uniref:Coiled-coil domain containing 38 n=5 Tax=Cercopithecidae TaxID=9527 RepID=A0A2K5NIK2_CERAT
MSSNLSPTLNSGGK